MFRRVANRFTTLVRGPRSLEHQLPLLIALLLLVVLGGLAGTVYREVRRAAVATGGERLDGVTRQLAGMLQTSARQRMEGMRRAADDPAFAAYLRAPRAAEHARAQGALSSLTSEELVAAVELWDTAGRRVLAAGRLLPEVPPELAQSLRRGAEPSGAAIGPFHVLGDSLSYPAAGVVRAGGRTLGFVVERRLVLSQGARPLAELIGPDASLLIGNADGTLWTDFARRTDAPPVGPGDTSEVLAYERPGRGARFARATAVTGTPWLLVIEFPQSLVLAPVRGFVVRLAALALLFVVAGAAVGWVASLRLTAPLRALTAAAGVVAAGRPAPHLPPGHSDEVGRLAEAFNTMAEQVERARAGLEQQVAERTRALEEARERLQATSEERYRVLFHQNPLPMWVYDSNTLRFLDVNEAAVRHYGYARDEFLGMTLKDIRPPEDVARLLETIPDSPGGLYEAGVWRHTKKDGALIDVEVTRHRLTLGGREVGLVLAHDITPRLAAERELRALTAELDTRVQERTEQLRASEERFRALAQTATDAIVSADARGVITYCNPAAERSFGYAASEAVGQPLTLLMPERLRDAHRAGLARYVAGGEPHVVGRTVELVGRRRDGSEFPLELSLAGWRSGSEPAFAGIIRDITDRKHAEEARDRALVELQAVNRELEAFSYTVSHDLRAPLRAMDGFSRILDEDYGPRLDDEARRLLGVIRHNARQMGALIDDLLAFARLGRKELEPARVNMESLAKAAVAATRDGAGPPHADVRVTALPAARGDVALLKQVWANLVQNAFKFSRLRPEPRIEIGARESEHETVYFVTDNGVGFDMKYADKLFGVFQRLHRPEEFEGTGVGLAIVQRIVHRHGGRVWAEGTVDGGATFSFSLPTEGPAA